MKKQLKIFLIGLAAVVAALGGLAIFQRGNSNEVTYREESVKTGDLEITVQSTGTVEPENRLAIKPPVAGRVEQVVVKEGEEVKRGQILAWMSSSERAALLDAARSDGEAAVKRWEKNYKPTPIIAPIDGTVITRNVENGQTFTNVDSVFTMSDRLTVKAQVDETDIGQLKVGQNSMITLDAYPQLKIEAKVDHIAFDAQTVNNVTTYVVTVIPKEIPPQMRSGMTATVNFQILAKNKILLVPNEALKMESDAALVLVKEAGPKPVHKKIEIGISDGKKTEVISGLADGDTVLIKEAGKLKASGANPFLPTPGRRRSK